MPEGVKGTAGPVEASAALARAGTRGHIQGALLPGLTLSTPVASQLADALSGRYVIERELGRGGMATVFLARDVQHRRMVALKVLDRELGAALGAERFLREIETAAGLQHPHILPVFDSGTSGAAGALWYTMPYVEGESLRERLAREGALPVRDAVRLASEIAAALDYAHRHGVIHRDIKPENILLSDGQALVADFGIARSRNAEGSQALTATGLSLGTPAYMSPEQVTGEREIDGRADIYSLGCLVYEMIAGRPPYAGPTAQAVIAGHLAQPVPRLSAARPGVPPAVESAVARAMAKSPQERYASAADFAGALSRGDPAVTVAAGEGRGRWKRVLGIACGAAAAALVGVWIAGRLGAPGDREDPAGLAVIPFRVPAGELALWREGLVDLFAADLDGGAGYHVIHPRTSLSRWRKLAGGGEADEGTIGSAARSLGARYVLTGSLTGSGPVRLALELYRSGADAPQRFQVDGSVDSIPSLVDQASLALLQSVSPQHDGGAPEIGGLMTRSLPALKAYLAGEQKFRRAHAREAIPDFRRAVELDSNFALALYRLATAEQWTFSPHYLGTDGWEALDRARHLTAGLTRRDALLVLGTWEAILGWPEALTTFAELTSRYPDDAEAWFMRGETQFHFSTDMMLAQAPFRESFERAIALDSTFAPPYLHYVEDAFARDDSATVRRAVAALRRIDSSSVKAVGLGLADDLVWGTAETRTRVREVLGRVPTDALLTAKHAINFAPELAESTLVLAGALAGDRARPLNDRVNASIGVLWVALYRGRLNYALAFADTLAALARGLPEGEGFYWWKYMTGAMPTMLAAVGYPVDTAFARRQLEAAPTEAVSFLLPTFMAALQRKPEAEGYVSRLDSLVTSGVDFTGADALDSLQLRRMIAGVQHLRLVLDAIADPDSLRPTSLAHLAAIQDSVRTSDSPATKGAQDLIFARRLLRGGRLDEAEREFRIAAFWPLYTVPAELGLGEVAEARGDDAAARLHYGRVVRWWRDCDPALRPVRDQARQGILRLDR
jgi:serine/threonine-protein kinase